MAKNTRKQNCNSQYMKILKEGVDDNQWGYGIKRISVTVNKDVDVGFHHKIPYTFTSLGYKAADGKWYVGLRMNVDQNSPLKLRPMNANTELSAVWVEMMHEFMKESVMKHKQ